MYLKIHSSAQILKIPHFLCIIFGYLHHDDFEHMGTEQVRSVRVPPGPGPAERAACIAACISLQTPTGEIDGEWAGKRFKLMVLLLFLLV